MSHVIPMVAAVWVGLVLGLLINWLLKHSVTSLVARIKRCNPRWRHTWVYDGDVDYEHMCEWDYCYDYFVRCSVCGKRRFRSAGSLETR